MQVWHHILIAASAECIFAIYTDVANWHTWDPDTRQASINGPFQVGTQGVPVPTKGNTVPMRLTSVITNKCFIVESKIPLFRMIFEHNLLPHTQGTHVTHRVTFSGARLSMIGHLPVKRLNKGLSVTLANLKKRAEHHP